MRVRLWIQQRHELPCASRKFQGIGCAMIGGEGDGLEVVEKLLEEEMLMGASNHLVRVMLMMLVIWNDVDFWSHGDLGNGSSSEGHECVWLLMMSEGDGELVLSIWSEFMRRNLFKNGMNLDKFREFQKLFKHSGKDN
ncbi:hypothetical protein Tco_0786726 [Tanacetum coccineum]